MKKNRGLMIAIAAGVTVAGLVAFLAFTETGKDVTKKWKVKGRKLAGKAEDIIKDAKKKFEDLKEEFVDEYKADVVREAYE